MTVGFASKFGFLFVDLVVFVGLLCLQFCFGISSGLTVVLVCWFDLWCWLCLVSYLCALRLVVC